MPQMGYDTKTDWLIDCQSQYDFGRKLQMGALFQDKQAD
jgi:hypothetical protein